MCGIVAVKGVHKAIETAVVGGHALQTRARTYAGGVSSDGQHLLRHAGKGLTQHVFGKRELTHLHGLDALLHLRYPTGEDDDEQYDNTQPIEGIYGGRKFAVAHNGNLTNCEELRAFLPAEYRKTTSIDTEYIVRLLDLWQTGDREKDLAKVFSVLKGSFQLCILFPDLLVAVSDPSGCHPLAFGVEKSGGWCVASENSAFPAMEVKYVADVKPGTMLFFENGGPPREVRFAPEKRKQCVFELLYNSLPTSRIFGQSVWQFREKAGEKLAERFPIPPGEDAIVVGVPDSANPIAEGYAKRSGIPCLKSALIRNHFVGRTFIAASQGLRNVEVSRKFIFDSDAIRGKRVVVVDDSIVRGTTMPKIVETLRFLGASEIHLRIAAPKIIQVCRYGIYMDEDETDLIARTHSHEGMRQYFNATSIEFLELEHLRSLLPDSNNYCFTCMGEQYW